MPFTFEPMQREASKLSVAVFAPSGAGKTTAAFKIAMGIRNKLYPGEKLEDIGLFIDTERRSSTKSVGRSIGGDVLEPMEMYSFEPPYDVLKLQELLEYAITQCHKKIIVVDSYTAFWSGSEGILERVAEYDVNNGASKKMYGGWSEKEIIRKKNVLKNMMSSSEAHVIMCFRAKTEYVIEMNERGKQQPKAIGVKEDMQSDVRYEFDAVLSLDKETHNVEVVKDRIGFSEYRMTSENPEAPLTVADGEILAKLVSEGLTLEEVAQRKVAMLRRFILNEKAHKASKIKAFETAKNVTIDEAYLDSLNYDMLAKLTQFLKG